MERERGGREREREGKRQEERKRDLLIPLSTVVLFTAPLWI